MLTRRAVLAAAIVLTVAQEPVHVFAQDAPCDADPRWLLVTVIESEIYRATGEHVENTHRRTVVVFHLSVRCILPPLPSVAG